MWIAIGISVKDRGHRVKRGKPSPCPVGWVLGSSYVALCYLVNWKDQLGWIRPDSLSLISL